MTDATAAIVTDAAAQVRIAANTHALQSTLVTTPALSAAHRAAAANTHALADRLDVLARRLDHVSDVWQANMRGDDDAPDLIEAVGCLLSTVDPRNDPDPDA